MKKRTKLKLLALVVVFFGLLSSSKSMAKANCTEIQENNVKYVNATLNKINREEYNKKQRGGMHWTTYYNLPMNQRYDIDSKSMLFASTEGMCIGGLQNGYLGLGNYGNSTGVLQGLVNKKLTNDKLYVVDKYTNKDSFFVKNANEAAYSEVLTNWKFPFLKQPNGYYSFNSDEYHVTRDYANRKYKLHKGARSGFYPFNNCNDDTSDMKNRNLGFTVRMDIPFIMTEDGKVKNSETKQYEDMVFNFSGDDDVWVYVDDTLVLDLGGNHIKLAGNINFAKNEVYYESIYNKETNTDQKDVYKKAFDGGKLSLGKHTLKVFYMERAAGESNLFVTFNLQSGGVRANYIDLDTGKVLTTESQSGAVGEKVTTKAKDIKGYVLVGKPDTETYTLTEELKTVNYYYSKKSNVYAKYVDIKTNKEIEKTETISGKYGDRYQTKQKDISNYKFVKSEGNTAGMMNGKDITVTYYYIHKSKITVNYIDEETKEKIDTFEKEVYEGDKFTSEERNYEDYILTKKPEKENVVIGKEDITLNYYYRRLKFNLKIEMNLDKAYVRGNYYGLNGKIGKIETEIRDANKYSDLEIYYKIKVTNNQERLGSGYITFTIPSGYTLINTDWQVEGNKAKLKVNELEIGETREYYIGIRKSEGIELEGDIKAFVKIESEKLLETTLDDNEDMNELAVMPRTGKEMLSVIPYITGLSAVAVSLVIVLRKKKTKENKNDTKIKL